MPENGRTPMTQSRLDQLEMMLLIRRFEEAGERLSLRGKIPAGVHPAIGQEAVAVGTMAALDPGDIVCGTHRSHHLALARGPDPSDLMAELYGKGTGLLGGRGGSITLPTSTLASGGATALSGQAWVWLWERRLACTCVGTRRCRSVSSATAA